MAQYNDKQLVILESVIRLMEEGVDLRDLKAADIAEAAGIGKGTLYLYFSSKEDIILQALLHRLDVQVEQMVRWGKFQVVGHLTLPLRYFNEMRGFHTSFDPYEEQIREILKTLIENGRGIELNCNRGNQPLPDGKWLKIYRELGGEIITLGTDAHSTQHVGCSVRERQALLKSCGFTRFCTFEKQKPIWHAL